MNDDTGMTSIVSQLHERLGEARESARSNLPSVEELVEWEQGDQDRTAASVTEVESEAETKSGGQRTLVTPPPKEDSGEGEETSESATKADSGSRRCSECGKRYHADFPDEEHPDLCEDCIVSKSEIPTPTTEWREESLGWLAEAILDVLREVYPQELSASEIADRLPARNIQPSDANRSAVNSELYGALRDWLRKKGRRPPVWSLQPAEGRIDKSDGNYDRSSNQPPFEASDPPSPSAESPSTGGLRESFESAGEDEAATSAAPRSPGEEDEASQECAICSEPMEDSHEWRGERMCSSCYNLFSDLRE